MAKSRTIKDRGNPVANAAVLAWESVSHPLAYTTFVVEDDVVQIRTGSPSSIDIAFQTATKRRAPGPNSPQPAGPPFKLVFGIVSAVTVLAGVAYVILAMVLPDTINDTKKQALEFAKMIGQTGFGAMVGLLGGKVVS